MLLIGASMSVMNATIVNVALPSMRASLGATPAALSWIISGWALAFGLSFIPAGRLGDRIGHRRIFLLGIGLFALSSAACGMAQSVNQMIGARIVQGIAGGLFFPTATIYIQLLFKGAFRGKAFAVMAMVLGLASALGPMVGGLLISAFGAEKGWRLVFFVNLPVGLLVFVWSFFLLPKKGEIRGTAKGFDLLGLLLLTAGLSAILVPLIEGRAQGWPAWTYMSLASGAGFLVILAAWEKHLEHKGSFAVLPAKLFRHASFSAGVVLELVFYASFVSIFYILSLLWQSGFGNSALSTGILSVPFAFGSILGATYSARITRAIGRQVLVIGTAALALGLLSIALILSSMPVASISIYTLFLPLFVVGIGSGLFVAPNVQFIVATADPSDAGAAGGVVATMQRIGTSIGLAIVGSVFWGCLDLPRGSIGRAGTAEVANAFAHSASVAIGVCAGLAVIATALVFSLPKFVDQHYRQARANA